MFIITLASFLQLFLSFHQPGCLDRPLPRILSLWPCWLGILGVAIPAHPSCERRTLSVLQCQSTQKCNILCISYILLRCSSTLSPLMCVQMHSSTTQPSLDAVWLSWVLRSFWIEAIHPSDGSAMGAKKKEGHGGKCWRANPAIRGTCVLTRLQTCRLCSLWLGPTPAAPSVKSWSSCVYMSTATPRSVCSLISSSTSKVKRRLGKVADVKQTAKPFRASLHYPEERKAAGRDQAGL